MPVAFVDLAAQFRRLEPEIRAAVEAVLRHGRYVMGPEVEALEAELARRAGTAHAVACSSGTDALLLPLMAWGIGPGDAVFTTPFTFVATAEVIALAGAEPVFVDIDPATFNLDPAALPAAVARVRREGRLRPRAVIPVDLFGLPADYDRIRPVAEAEGLRVLEDAAQAFGAAYRGRPAGGLGDAGATSFYPAKPLGAYGDGGAVFTDDADLAGLLRSIRVHGQEGHQYENVRIGLNARLDTLQAAVLLVKLRAFDAELAARQRVADYYGAALEGVVQVPEVPEGCRSAWAQYSVLLPEGTDREALRARLLERGIPTMVYYPKPLHLQRAFAGLGHREGDFPAAEAASRRVLSLPMHPDLSEADLREVTGALRAALGEAGR
ncbi:DegT/DnrJ/EryC1/StrS family aminotransferase [Dissulfurirhabdus thermomarina]|uniref:DegT/DnrJ/EryC1/StrS family aminotransferase n=1 Tax=Dissulfurirhabdus thermomarina TaxID=1765737 RepID=A0A6N9TKS0_DISTH|nr:DegT/DnrJ/EryC1/StrS family aminotransferase [Dissulfurirhabdus thermomarina]NDY41871.1 DegT/DnrJ/EryC1/StrS family aminotransferase [Dissulfurirhabdus thermomarina]NMX22572.1 DegT/DnrJ/EryC1/StrS family aminotransferase [Dissulfurirhabdus thermomarina]